jgi:carboxymethylenebutenolidase
MGERIAFDCPGGSQAGGYFKQAEGATAGIVVLQEWWGLNPQICEVADRFVEEGLTALAPDLYHGRVTQSPDEANHMMSGLDWVGATEVEVAGAVAHLKQDVDKVAVMGFCMGGALTIIAGVKLADCDAAVCYYGIPPKEQADPAAMAVPLLGHFATQDDWCTPDAVDALEAGLAQSPSPVELHRYEAEHAFFNETVSAYDEDAAELSWQRTMAFLKAQL